ncbi:MAG: hypothetical protein ACKPKO_15800 [Candidatus Fonsibacter sp.]
MQILDNIQVAQHDSKLMTEFNYKPNMFFYCALFNNILEQSICITVTLARTQC